MTIENQIAKTVLLTGASSGLGHAFAQTYLAAGWNVYAVSRRPPADLLDHTRLIFQPLDLSTDDEIADSIDRLLANIQQVDLAILNAGVLGRFGDLTEIPVAEMKQTMDVNLWANKLVLDGLFARGRNVTQVVMISSGASVNGNRGWNGYALSKAALNMLTKLAAAERPHTHFTAFSPGLVDTAMQDTLCTQPADPRFPSLEVLRSKRGTPEMSMPEEAARRMVPLFAELPSRTDSGAFVDVRRLPFEE